MSTDQIDKALQYALVVAGSEDLGQRQLGPIHLLKYVYLGDLEYAEAHDGQTFTGAPWRFFHYGPWAEQVADRIEPALGKAGSQKRIYTNTRFDNDAIRYELVNEALRRDLERELPKEVTRAIRMAVHKFGIDTSELLHFVYRTAPMLHAAPGEPLQFATAARQGTAPAAPAKAPRAVEPISKTALRKRSERLDEVRAELKAKIAERKKSKKRIPAPIAPRYDDLFIEGLKALDAMDLAAIQPSEGELEIGDGIWKSAARTESDLP